MSLLYLTNFRLGDWVRATFSKKTAGDGEMTDEERELDRRAKDLAKQARKLQDQVERSKVKTEKADKIEKAGREKEEEDIVPLGADLQPVPVRSERDLSVPAAKQAKGSRS